MCKKHFCLSTQVYIRRSFYDEKLSSQLSFQSIISPSQKWPSALCIFIPAFVNEGCRGVFSEALPIYRTNFVGG
jgi:hypothetical protein